MRPILHVCTTCRAGLPLAEGQVPPGRHMYEAVARHADAGSVALREVACLSLCEHGCAAAISMPGKWSYLLGRLDAGLAGDLLDYAVRYAESGTGAVMPSKRAPSLARMVLGRLPA